MTEDELDLLASAYLDGEATPEEVALVERDPDLLARVETMRAVSGQLGTVPGPPPDLKEQHLAAALAAFDATADLGAADENVLDFKAGAQGRRTTERAKRRRSASIGGLPSWLPAAAVFVLITGGVIALVNSGSDDFDTASDTAAESSDESTEAGSDAADMTQGEADSDATAAVAAESEMADDGAEDEEAMADEEEAMEEDAGDDTESATDDASGAASTTTARNQFIPQEPVLMIDAPVSDLDLAQMLADLPELIDPVESNCAERLELGPDLEPVAYVPVLVSGLPAELFLLVDGAGAETGRLFETETCAPIE